MINEGFVEPDNSATKQTAKKTPKATKQGYLKYSVNLNVSLVELLIKKLKVKDLETAIRIIACCSVNRQDMLSDDRIHSVANAKSRLEISVEQLKQGQAKAGWETFRSASYDLCKYGCVEISEGYTLAVRGMLKTFVIPAKSHLEGCWDWIRQIERYQSLARKALHDHDITNKVLIPGPPATTGAYLVVKSDQQFYAEIKHAGDPLLEDVDVLYYFPVPMISEYMKQTK